MSPLWRNVFSFKGILALMMSALLLTSCESTQMAVETNTSTTMTMKYAKFTGQKEKTIQVEDGRPLDVGFEVTTDAGQLDISLTDEQGNHFYQGKQIQTSSFTVHLDQPGSYRVDVKGNQHKGGFAISWGSLKQ
ncbi:MULTISPECIES: hypothetical protein [Paenibacillus]|uniref:hypothetical protein n=1 Tax=Paenibacillus TaxID=44249 RepID=UPI002FE4243A